MGKPNTARTHASVRHRHPNSQTRGIFRESTGSKQIRRPRRTSASRTSKSNKPARLTVPVQRCRMRSESKRRGFHAAPPRMRNCLRLSRNCPWLDLPQNTSSSLSKMARMAPALPHTAGKAGLMRRSYYDLGQNWPPKCPQLQNLCKLPYVTGAHRSCDLCRRRALGRIGTLKAL